MRRIALLLIACTGCVSAAVIQGMVLDEETGNPLARAQVTLLPLPGTGTSAVSLRNGERGAFSILSVQPGWYVLRVTRRGFAAAEAGQLRAGRPGAPFEVTAEDRASFIQIRMTRLGAVTGTVLDENSIGIPDWPVHIYSAKRPVRRIAEVVTDDRGNYRIGGLDPGNYVVRSGGGALEDDATLLPTYYKYGTRLENAEIVKVKLGQTQPDIVVRPQRGRLYTVSGIMNAPGDRGAKITLITDTGRRVLASVSPPMTQVPFEATGLAPGPIELLVEGPGCGGYARLIVGGDSSGQRIGCGILRKPVVEWRIDNAIERAQLQYPVLVRRADLDGLGPVQPLKLDDPLVPGHWETIVQTGKSHYVTGIRAGSNKESVAGEDGWFPIDVDNQTWLKIGLSSRPGSVGGAVITGGKPVTGAVVYMELFDPTQQIARIRLFSTRTDVQGNFSFAGLAPGRYRLLSTYDFDPDDFYVWERAAPVTVKELDQATQQIELILP